jgi:putative ABC transport system permease protein
MIGAAFQDAKYAVALLIKKPAFSLVAIVGLTLGIGANTAIFSVVHALLLRPLPYHDPGRLVSLRSLNTRDPKAPTEISYPNFVDWRDQSHDFDGMAAYAPNEVNLTAIGDPERLHGAQASYNLFPVLGVNPVAGRSFLPEEDRPGARQVALISFGLWQRLFGGNRAAIGTNVTLDGALTEIVGVLPPDFKFIPGTDVWTPLATQNDPNMRLALGLEAIGKLKPGVSLSEAGSQLEAIAARLAEQYPATNKDWSVAITPLQEQIIGKFRPALLLLLGAVALVLLIACANVANLLLAHASSRRKEVAIRLAVGASRFRIVANCLPKACYLDLSAAAWDCCWPWLASEF